MSAVTLQLSCRDLAPEGFSQFYGNSEVALVFCDAACIRAWGFGHSVEVIKLIGFMPLCFTVSHGGVEQVFRPAVKLLNPPGFSR
jgi:hypothetical protein